MGSTRLHLFLLASLALPVTAKAEDCPIERAVYREMETGVELSFFPASGENTPVSHGFTMKAAGEMQFEGHILYDPEIERPIGMAMLNCPEGDVTGATLASCTVWKGIIYGVDRATAAVDVLPPESAAAPDVVILPGFGPALMAFSQGAELPAVPWDVFEFKSCSPKA